MLTVAELVVPHRPALVSVARLTARIAVDRSIGQLPLFEYLLESRRMVPARRLRRLEDRYVEMLHRQLGALPPADVVTVIATYRRPAQLREAVASALGQTYPDHRVVVVDDGGGLPCGLPEDPRLTAISLPANVGVAGIVRNVGIRLSSSRLIAFLDDDNVWDPHHLEVAVAGHDEDGEVGVTYSQLRRVDERGELIDVIGEPFSRRALRRTPISDTNVLVIRRDDRVRFSRVPRRRGDFPLEDWELLWRLSRRMAVRFIPVVTATYLQHGGSYFSEWSTGAE